MEFNFKGGPSNPKGLDFRGLEMIQNMAQKIDKRPLREYLNSKGELKDKPLNDFVTEVKETQSKKSQYSNIL